MLRVACTPQRFTRHTYQSREAGRVTALRKFRAFVYMSIYIYIYVFIFVCECAFLRGLLFISLINFDFT
jgi:hypothetical protein